MIAVRRGGAASKISFDGLPAGVQRGEVLFEPVQQPLPPPPGGMQVPRPVAVSGGAFSDWFASYDVHVYRFEFYPSLEPAQRLMPLSTA